ncbi:hypothetical protein ACGFNU_14115 [Spirillospora sp. NPDC048911]|uniref:hypothetical protein n=1 Tax=Spirillospora sp. NPDC048911 TaxID=3364527 RepID=UPI003713D607
MVGAYRHSRLGEAEVPAGPDLAAEIDAARDRRRGLQEHLRSDEFEGDGWLIYGALLLEVDRLLSGLTPD